MLVTLGGCGLLNGSSGDDGSVAASSTVEKPKVNIGILATVDGAPVKLAQVNDYFRRQGLDPNVKVFQTGPQMYPALKNGDLDITLTNYVNYFAATARKSIDAKIVSDAWAATPRSIVLLTRPNSGIRSPRDLVGKRIAIQTPGNIVELLLRSLMEVNDLDPEAPQYLPVKFPNMPAALETKQIDAAVILEPYLSQAERDIGARPAFDLITDSTNDMPLSGYIASTEFIEKNPKTVRAFQRAMVQAQKVASDNKQMRKVLPGLTGVQAATVPMLNLGSYPTSLEAMRLQRVIKLMQTYNYLNADLHAENLIVPLAGAG